MTLRIGIDARPIESAAWGVGRVLDNLVRQWGKDSRGHRFFLYFKNQIPERPELKTLPFECKTVPPPFFFKSHRLWEQISLPRQIEQDQLDVFLAPSYIIPLNATCPTAVIIHDVSFARFPGWYSLKERIELAWLIKRTVRKANRIICCSEDGKQELLGFYGKRWEPKVQVVPWAADERFKPASEPTDTIQENYGINGPYFLYVGYLFQRRNLPLLIKGFHCIAEQFKDVSLVIIGRDKDYGGSLPGMIRDLKLEQRIRIFDYVSEEDLLVFYQHAFCLVHPSTYEGFGLPVIEALACGVPVLLGPSGALKEAAGEAAFIIDPFTEEGMGNAMSSLLESKSLYQDLKEKGRRHADLLTWERTASEVLNGLEQTAGSGKLS